MPYRDPEDRRINDQYWEIRRQRKYWSDLGFDLMSDEPRSDVQCQYCGRVSARTSAHMFRHEDTCVNYTEPKFWNRRKRAA